MWESRWEKKKKKMEEKEYGKDDKGRIERESKNRKVYTETKKRVMQTGKETHRKWDIGMITRRKTSMATRERERERGNRVNKKGGGRGGGKEHGERERGGWISDEEENKERS